MADHEASSVGKCPQCGALRVHKFRPFCSKRCAQVDLNRWFNGSYAVPAVDPPDWEGDEAPPSETGTNQMD